MTVVHVFYECLVYKNIVFVRLASIRILKLCVQNQSLRRTCMERTRAGIPNTNVQDGTYDRNSK